MPALRVRHRSFICRTAAALLALPAILALAQPGPPADERPSGRPRRSDPQRPSDARRPSDNRRHPGAASRPTQTGLILETDQAFAGYTLFAPLNSTTTYLVDMKGKLAHSWPSKYVPGQSVQLLDDGSLLRTARQPRNRSFFGGGIGGRVERLAPDGKVLWEFVYADDAHCLHHAVEPLPNGHVLMIAWEKKSRDEVLRAGRDPAHFTAKELWPDCVIEVKPTGTTGGEIVWEWHVWDHLVQSLDKSKPNYGRIADHPELIDINFASAAPRMARGENRRLRGIGYLGGDGPDETADKNADGDDDGPPRYRGPGWPGGPGGRDGPPGRGGPGMMSDWCHTNAIAYNPALDQIALSIHNFSEVWIIDHGTTTKEAAGHKGGRSGKGGDLLYRWGNPRAYGAGSPSAQRLFAQHDVRWIPDGLPGAGHLTVFNNGTGRPGVPYSSIVEFAPPVDSAGRYKHVAGQPFGPSRPAWEYTAKKKTDFFASHISGAHRLPNGNTLICDGEAARMFEVTREGKTVWDYVNPYQERRGPPDGDGPPDRMRPRPNDGNDDGGPPGDPRPRRDNDGGRPDGPRPPRGDDVDDNGPPNDVRPPRGDGDGDGPPDGFRPRPDDGDDDGRLDPPGPDDNRPRRGERRPGMRRPGDPRGFRGGPMGGGGGVFRATRLAPDHPGLRRLLEETKK